METTLEQIDYTVERFERAWRLKMGWDTPMKRHRADPEQVVKSILHTFGERGTVDDFVSPRSAAEAFTRHLMMGFDSDIIGIKYNVDVISISFYDVDPGSFDNMLTRVRVQCTHHGLLESTTPQDYITSGHTVNMNDALYCNWKRIRNDYEHIFNTLYLGDCF